MKGTMVFACLSSFLFSSSVSGKMVNESARELPVLYDVDIVVVGGTSGGVAAAVEAARQGASVFLAAPRPYLGEDLCGTYRLWLEPGEEPATPLAKKLFAERWYLDHMYRYLLDRFVHRGFALLFSRCDQNVVDGCVDGLGETTVKSGSLLSALQSGRVQLNLVFLFIVLTLVALTYFF